MNENKPKGNEKDRPEVRRENPNEAEFEDDKPTPGIGTKHDPRQPRDHHTGKPWRE